MGQPKISRQRADIALVEAGLVDSRTKAAALIMAGLAYVGTTRIAKAGELIPPGAALSLKGQDHPWVSRGGVKLAHGLAHFNLDPTGATALDIGASTGGFTDVLLTQGAKKIYAVDVGHGQLAWKIRSDPRVVVLEKTNARNLTPAQIPDPITALVCDASFIGLRTILPAGLALCAPGAFALVLIKPQFEAGQSQVGKGGVVRDPAIHQAVCDEITTWFATLPSWEVLGVEPSPITGPEGNIEFLLGARKAASEQELQHAAEAGR